MPGEEGGFFSKLKNMFFGDNETGKKGGWGLPAVVGVVTGLVLGAPVGLGAFVGLRSVSNETGLTKGKNAGLKAVGATTGAVCTGVCALIGTAIFPIVGTLIGAAIGALISGPVSKLAVKKAKQTKFFKSKGHMETHTVPPHTQSTSRVQSQFSSNVIPVDTPSKSKGIQSHSNISK